MIRDHLGNVAPNELMNPLWTRIRRFIILIQHDPSDLGTLILILIRNAPRYLGTWKRLDVELQVVIKKNKTGEIYQFQNRKSTFGSKVSRQRQHYIKEVLEFSVFNVILQHWQKPAPGEVTRSTSANKQQHFVTNNVN